MGLKQRAADAFRDKKAADDKRRQEEATAWQVKDRGDRERRAPLIEAWFAAELGCEVHVDPDSLAYWRGGHEAEVEVDGLTFLAKIGPPINDDRIEVLYDGRTLHTYGPEGEQTALAVLGEILAHPSPPSSYTVRSLGAADRHTTTA